MDINAARASSFPLALPFAGAEGANTPDAAGKAQQLEGAANNGELRKAFDSFVGESFYNQLLSSMQKTVGKPAYFHGGKAEEVFRGQLNQTLATKMTEANASEFTGSMFELFNLSRQ